MRKILDRLNEIPGIRGSIVVSPDGMVVAASLSRRLDEDKVAAMASSVVASTVRSLSRRGLPGFFRFTLTSSYGKMVFHDMGATYLVVVMDRNYVPGPTDIELESAAMRIKALGELRVV